MCDMNKYARIYKDINKLTQEDTLQLVMEASTEEEQEFYEMVSDYLLQKRQRECIARKVF